jgi:hypothetical protein
MLSRNVTDDDRVVNRRRECDGALGLSHRRVF